MKLEQLPDDVRRAAIESFQESIRLEVAPLNESDAILQKKRFELLAESIIAGFSAIISSQ